jgi:hypothetical protein
VPKEGMQFNEGEDAYEFYCVYGKLAGFDVRRNRKRTQAAWYVCNKGIGTVRLWTNKQRKGQRQLDVRQR